ncbi:MAG: hypothetical protein R8P61_31685 [Bacteroidia bacterium]|nr:hypothetical protein [Bacteroidia bacterium]
MKKTALLLICSLLLHVPLLACPQDELKEMKTKMGILQNNKGVPTAFKQLGKTAFYAAVCQYFHPKTGMCLKDARSFSLEQIQSARTKALIRFEDALRSGKGVNLMPSDLYQQAMDRYPGSRLEALIKRFKFYLGSLSL